MRLFAALLTLLLAMTALPAAAATKITDPKAFVADVYARLAKDQDKLDVKLGYGPPEDIYTPRLEGLWAEEIKDADGELGRLDFFFWVNGQDWKLSDVAVTERTMAGHKDRKIVTVDFKNFDSSNALDFYFDRVGDRWLIDDVSSTPVPSGDKPGESWTLSLILKYGFDGE